MVRKIAHNFYFPLSVLILSLMLIFETKTVFANEFSASVNTNEIGYNQKIKLALKLTDKRPKNHPDLDSLKGNFKIMSTSNYSSTKIINGDYFVEHEWIYTLQPLKKGQIDLGPFLIYTQSGLKKSNKVTVRVLDTKIKPSSKSNGGNTDTHNDIFIKTEVSKNNPYKKEPFIYYVRLFTDVSMHGINISKLEIDDTIIEPIDKFKVLNKTYNGKDYLVMEWSFHITPLKTGTLEIPEIEVIGQVTAKNSIPLISDLFDSPLGNNFDDYQFDSPTLRKNEIFQDYSDKVQIDVQPSNDNIDPWIPASSLKLFDEWENGAYEVGKPFIRTISLHASGLLSSQLPEIDVPSIPGKYRVFSDLGSNDQNIDNNLITSKKEIKLTYIPQDTGQIIIPEIKINYWNVDKQVADYTILPEKKINILPVADDMHQQQPEPSYGTKSHDTSHNQNHDINMDQNIDIEDTVQNQPSQELTTNHITHMVIAAIAGMATTLLIGGVIFILLKRKNNPRDQQQIVMHNELNSMQYNDVGRAKNAGQIQKIIRNYASNKWNFAQNLSIASILLQLKAKYNDFDYDKYKVISENLNKLLYSEENTDLELLKKLSQDFINHVDNIIDKSHNKKVSSKTKKLPKINPL